MIAYFCYGSHLAIFPAISSKVFGIKYGPQVYGLMFIGIAIGGVIQWGLIELKEMTGERGILFI